MKQFRVPLRTQINRLWMPPLFRALFRTLCKVKISGSANVPARGAYVVAFNHISIYDPPLAVFFWPWRLEVIAGADVFGKKGQGTILRLYGVIPVHRGDYDRVVLETLLTILKSGHPLAITPEGGRSHVTAMRRAMPGIGYIIEHARVPVVPVGLVGTTDDLWQRARRGHKPALEMRIGPPIDLPPITASGAERRDARQQNADLVMRHIAGLLPEEYHGAYAGQAIRP